MYMKRRFWPYLLQTYLPTTLLVLLSMVTFFIDQDLIAPRISLGVIFVLGIITQTVNRQAVSSLKAIDVWYFSCLVIIMLTFLEVVVVHIMLQHQKAEKLARERAAAKAEELRNTLDNRTSPDGRRSTLTPLSTAIPVQDENRKSVTGLFGEEIEQEEQIRPTVVHHAHAHHRESVIKRKESIAKHMKHHVNSWRGWLQKVRGSPPLKLDVTCRIAFPLVFVCFNIWYWLYYTYT